MKTFKIRVTNTKSEEEFYNLLCNIRSNSSFLQKKRTTAQAYKLLVNDKYLQILL